MTNRPWLVASYLLAVFLFFSLWSAKGPPDPVPATAPDTVFSAERAMRHVRAIAATPHQIGTAGHARVRGYIEEQIRTLGLEPVIQEGTAIGTRFQQAGWIRNVLTRVPGRTPGPAVLLAAHYDGVGAAPAASDDASGSAVLLETLRALVAGGQLEHDVIALWTDGEEAGLLGAAAFVRDHPWAKDVRMILNFEARGTGGQVAMFQTGPGNRDQIRELAKLPHVSATSLAVTVYQFLPNDTDLSEFFSLEQPGLNFAYADGLERYHTSEDDADHIDPGSIQQEGGHALGLTRIFANGPLPRPKTGNAVFFDLPLLGLVHYPEGAAAPIAVIALIAFVAAVVRVAKRERHWLGGLLLGLVAMVLSILLSGWVAHLIGREAPMALIAAGHRDLHAAGLVLIGVAITLLFYALIRRWVGPGVAALGPLFVWTAAGVAASFTLPGISFLPIWPALAGSLAAIAGNPPSGPGRFARWLPAPVTASIAVPIIYGMGLVALSLIGPGAIAVGGLTPLVFWLLAPDLELAAGKRRWIPALVLAALGAVAVAGARWTISRDKSFPIRSLLIYAENADEEEGWLVSEPSYAAASPWNTEALGPDARPVTTADSSAPGEPPKWLTRIAGGRFAMVARPTRPTNLAPPLIRKVYDSLVPEGRRLGLSITPAPGTYDIRVGTLDTRVLAATLDGIPIDTTRYRYRLPAWALSYSAPRDSGFVLSFTLERDKPAGFEIVARSDGLPAIDGVTIPPRPPGVVQSQWGDFTAIVRRVRF